MRSSGSGDHQPHGELVLVERSFQRCGPVGIEPDKLFLQIGRVQGVEPDERGGYRRRCAERRERGWHSRRVCACGAGEVAN